LTVIDNQSGEVDSVDKCIFNSSSIYKIISVNTVQQIILKVILGSRNQWKWFSIIIDSYFMMNELSN